MKQPMMLGVAGLALLAGTATALAANQGNRGPLVPVDLEAINFISQPGFQELSGQMIARPYQMEAWLEAGVPQDQALVKMAAARELMARYAVKEYVWQTDEYVFFVPEASDESAVSRELMASGLFQYVDPNYIVYPLACPNDPQLRSQWHHNANRMQSCDGWDLFTGINNVTVAICDTGIDTDHPDLLLHRVPGYNAVDRVWEVNGGQIEDINGHGTNCTGCSAANSDNGVGVAGVGWNMRHQMFRVSNSGGGGSTFDTLNHAARTAIENGAKVASVSYSGVDNSTNLTSATYVKSIGGLMVWAAGNESRNLTASNRDADDLIVAGATDENDNKSGFSNFGPMVDVTAPGSNVFTTARGGGYAAVSGTSFACPLTAGLIALIWSMNPSLTPDEVENILKSGVDDLGTPGIDNTFGYGRINVFGSLSLVRTPLEFAYPSGRPDMIDPQSGATLEVEIISVDSTYKNGSGRLFYNTGSGFQSMALSQTGPNLFEATIPPAACGDSVLYYVQAETLENETLTDPAGAPANSYSAFTAVAMAASFDDNFESDFGWTTYHNRVFAGFWTRTVPPSGSGRVEPGEDFDGSGKAWITGRNANEDLDGGPEELISPVFALDGRDAVVSYARWYSDSRTNVFSVEISNNGGNNWTVVEALQDQGEEWKEASFRVSDYVNPTNNMKVRFVASDANNNSTTEAAVDAFKVSVIECGDGFVLATSNVVAGQRATLAASYAEAGETVYFVYSINGVGRTTVPQLGVTLSLSAPTLAGSADANSGGNASIGVNVPAIAAGRQVWFQAAQVGRVSNVVANVVQ